MVSNNRDVDPPPHRLEDELRLGGLVFPFGGGQAAKAEPTILDVKPEEALVKQRGGAPVGHVAIEFELPEAVLADAKPLTEEGIANAACPDVRNAPTVTDNGDRSIEATEAEFAGVRCEAVLGASGFQGAHWILLRSKGRMPALYREGSDG